MNICFLFGVIDSEIEFEFFLNNPGKTSVAICTIFINEEEFLIKAFNELADKLYSEYKKDDILRIEGVLRENYVEISNFY